MSTDTLSPCASGSTRALERTRYYVRQLVTPEDFTQDQTYFREKLRRHNRMLHGWGIVCGACVRRVRAGGTELVVEPGYVLGPYGDEIFIDREVTVDLRRAGAAEVDGCCGEDMDQWCGDVRPNCPNGEVYVAVRYSECRARPVRGLATPCGCGDTEAGCEYSRIRDGFSLKVLRDLPASYSTMPPPAYSPCGTGGRARNCPPCPPDPWVILAVVRTNVACEVVSVDCFRLRRYVQSFGSYYVLCQGAIGALPPPPPMAGSPPPGVAFGVSHTLLLDERAARAGATPGIMVSMTRPDGTAVLVPGAFPVAAGETLRDIAAREGDRELLDPQTGTRTTLRDIFAMAKVDLDTAVDTTAAALGLLEGARFDPVGLTHARAAVARFITPDVQERLAAETLGAPQAAERVGFEALKDVVLPAASLRALRNVSVGEAADMSKDAFVAKAAAGRGAARDEAIAAAEAAWEAARTFVAGLRGAPI